MRYISHADLSRFFRRVAAESTDGKEIELANRFLNAPGIGIESTKHDGALADFEDAVNELANPQTKEESAKKGHGHGHKAEPKAEVVSLKGARPVLDWLWAHRQDIIDLIEKFLK